MDIFCAHCSDFLPPSDECDDSEYECEFNGRCISDDEVCNGVVDCADGSDELSCSKYTVKCVLSGHDVISTHPPL